METSTVFAACIHDLKKEALHKATRAASDVGDADILWVLTVPAVWDNDAVSILREVFFPRRITCHG